MFPSESCIKWYQKYLRKDTSTTKLYLKCLDIYSGGCSTQTFYLRKRNDNSEDTPL